MSEGHVWGLIFLASIFNSTIFVLLKASISTARVQVPASNCQDGGGNLQAVIPVQLYKDQPDNSTWLPCYTWKWTLPAQHGGIQLLLQKTGQGPKTDHNRPFCWVPFSTVLLFRWLGVLNRTR